MELLVQNESTTNSLMGYSCNNQWLKISKFRWKTIMKNNYKRYVEEKENMFVTRRFLFQVHIPLFDLYLIEAPYAGFFN